MNGIVMGQQTIGATLEVLGWDVGTAIGYSRVTASRLGRLACVPGLPCPERTTCRCMRCAAALEPCTAC